MSLSKTLKHAFFMALIALFFAGCGGTRGSSSDGAGYDSDNGDEGTAVQEEQKVDEDELKKTREEAMAVESENHELRRKIFDAKNKLGVPVDTQAE